MPPSRLPHILLVLLLVIFFFNFVGIYYDWFHVYWWYDIPLHIAGGAWAALVVIYILGPRTGAEEHMSRRTFVLLVIAIAMTIGVLWEIFEYSIDIFELHKYTFATVPREIRADSAKDLLDDLLGAVFVAAAWFSFKRKTRTAGELP